MFRLPYTYFGNNKFVIIIKANEMHYFSNLFR